MNQPRWASAPGAVEESQKDDARKAKGRAADGVTGAIG